MSKSIRFLYMNVLYKKKAKVKRALMKLAFNLKIFFLFKFQKYGGEGSAGGGGTQRLVMDQMRDIERQNQDLTSELRDVQSELNKEKRAAENVRIPSYL